MKIAMITDIHFGVRNDAKFFHDNLFKFIEETFLPYMAENGIKTLLILGDVWDRRKYVNFYTLYDVKKRFFDKLRDLGVEIKVIYGNHDVYFKNTNEVNSIDLLLDSYSNIEIVKTFKVFDFDGMKLGMISWIHSGNLEESLRWISTVECDVLCGHFEIKNFEMIRGHYCEHGFDESIFDRFEFVFSGHFHVINSNGRIYYIGNPNQTNWSDFGLKKGFHVFDTRTREIEFVENPFSVYEKYQYDDSIDLLAFDYSKFEGKIVRIYVNNFELPNRRKFDLFVDKVSQVAFNVDIQEIDTFLNQIDSDEITEVQYTDTMNLVDQYIEAINSEGIDKKKLRSYFNAIYNEALEKTVTA
jgi:DNA repair exonuclease SbcCD nuclease subunit